MSKSPCGFILYKIYYEDDFVEYLGRTKQPLQTRLRGHFFAKPMHKKVSIHGVTKIEYAECKTIADMYLYEIYYINKLKPPLNCDDKARDELTIALPDLEWKPYTCPLMDKWIREIDEAEDKRVAARQREIDRYKRYTELRIQHKNGELSHEDFEAKREAIGF